MKKVLSLMLVALMLFAMVACSGSTETSQETQKTQGEQPQQTAQEDSSEEEVVYFAVCGPMTGDNAEYGISFRQAVQVQMDIWNENGGLLGKKIEMVVYDDKSSPEEAANVAQQIVSDDRIVAVIGHFQSSCSMAAAPIYQENGMLEISPCSSHADYTAIGDHIWRVTQLSSDEAVSNFKMLTQWIEPAPQKIGLFIINNDWGVELGEVYKELFAEYSKETGVPIEVISETVVEGNDDYSSVVTNFASSGIDTLINCATYPVAVPFLNQLKDALPEVRVVSHINNMVQPFVDVLQKKSVGMINTAAFAAFYPEEDCQEFVKRFKELDANKLDPNPDSANYYDTAGVMFTAIKNCGSFDTDAIMEELKTIEYDGVSGILNFDENRNCPRDFGFCVINEDLTWEALPVVLDK
jgi:branched-chain amino acid transport system substrate-binding protein